MPVDGTIKGQQRIIRRLMTNPATTNPDGTTNPGDYLWHQDYGAGLPAKIGQPFNETSLRSLILAQMMMEDSVAKTPEPQVSVSEIPGGISVSILYNDAATSKQQFLSFNVTQ
jgi:hypothetical protein